MTIASIIIRAKNEARFIGRTLDAVFQQSEQDFEVIVIDSGSSDKTLEIARAFPVRIIEINPGDFTYGYALNLGMREAKGEFLISLSAHSLPRDSHWLAGAIEGFLDERVAGVYGRQLPREDASWADLFGMKVSGVMSTKPNRLRTGIGFSNANGAVRRSVWQTIPFDELIPGAEDLAWSRLVHRVGLDIVYAPKMAVYHSHRESLPKLLKRIWHDQPVILRVALGVYGNTSRTGARKPVGQP